MLNALELTSQMQISKRAANVLINAFKPFDLADLKYNLKQRTEAELLRQKGMGRGAFKEIKEAFGLRFYSDDLQEAAISLSSASSIPIGTAYKLIRNTNQFTPDDMLSWIRLNGQKDAIKRIEGAGVSRAMAIRLTRWAFPDFDAFERAKSIRAAEVAVEKAKARLCAAKERLAALKRSPEA